MCWHLVFVLTFVIVIIQQDREIDNQQRMHVCHQLITATLMTQYCFKVTRAGCCDHSQLELKSHVTMLIEDFSTSNVGVLATGDCCSTFQTFTGCEISNEIFSLCQDFSTSNARDILNMTLIAQCPRKSQDLRCMTNHFPRLRIFPPQMSGLSTTICRKRLLLREDFSPLSIEDIVNMAIVSQSSRHSLMLRCATKYCRHVRTLPLQKYQEYGQH